MRVNSNSTALSASLQLDFDTQLIEKLTQHLSTGLRINTAADDPSGLAISQTLLAQTRGTDMAVQNVQDTISLLQTAEGGMSSIVDAIQRMRVLALESANDTLTDDQRKDLQVEVNQLLQQIDMVARTTQFNDQNLLDGTYNVQFVPASVNIGTYLTDTGLDFTPNSLQTLALNVGPAGQSTSYNVSFTVKRFGVPGPFRDDNLSVLNRIVGIINGTGSGITASLLSNGMGQHALQLAATSQGTVYQFVDGPGSNAAFVAGLNDQSMNQLGQYFNVQSGANAGNTVPLLIPNMSTAALGLTGLSLTSSSAAESAIAVLDSAVQSVSGNLSVLGADESRMAQASMVGGSTSLNLNQAYSGLVDADIAHDASALAAEKLVLETGQSVLHRAITATYGMSLLTIQGIRERFPLTSSHLAA